MLLTRICEFEFDLASGAQMVYKLKLSTEKKNYSVDSVDCFLHMHSVVLYLLISNFPPFEQPGSEWRGR